LDYLCSVAPPTPQAAAWCCFSTQLPPALFFYASLPRGCFATGPPHVLVAAGDDGAAGRDDGVGERGGEGTEGRNGNYVLLSFLAV
jgi:hypothetical protein